MSYKLPNRKRLVRNLPHLWDVTDLIECIDSHKNKTAFRYFENGNLTEMTYSQFLNMIKSVCAAISKLGLQGKRIAVIGDTSPEWLASYIGTIAAGSIIIPMDKELALTEVEKFLSLVEADAVIYSSSFNEKFVTTINTHPTLKYFIPIHADYDSSFSSKIVPFSEFIEYGKEELENGYKIKTVMNKDVMCEMLFTSGTTGTSKCVMLCQKNIFAAVTSAVETVCFVPDDVVVSVLPIHHTYELMCLLAEMVFGITICINDSLRHVLKNFALFKPTGLVLVPLFLNTMYKKIWSEAERTGRSGLLKTGLTVSRNLLKVGIDKRRVIFKSVLDAFGGNLDHIICGGAKLNPDLVECFENFGISVFEGFGITECSPLVAVTPYYARKAGSIGPSVPSCRMRIDANGDKTPEGYSIGEIQVKGDNVMLGYYNNPDANAEVFTDDGWFRTGDVGYLDNDGYAFITGRIKFVIVLENGKNVFPEEIEEYLETIDTISECCVIGRKSESSDEVILTAVIYPDFTKFSKDDDDETIKESIRKSINAVNRKLPSFKQIKSVELRKSEFEKTTTKKIKRQLVK